MMNANTKLGAAILAGSILTAPATTSALAADAGPTGTTIAVGNKTRVLHHLPAHGEGLRLDGESPTRTWPVHITQAQLAGKVVLHLAYRNAVSIMPEASRFEVAVNGEQIAARPIRSPDRTRVLELEVPPHLMVPGVNALTLRARQRHRVDCSLEATHELWTDIDPARSGFVFTTGDGGIRRLSDLPALARDADGRVHMRLLLPDVQDAAKVARTIDLGQRAAVHAAFERPRVDVAAGRGSGPGLDVFVGNHAELAKVAPTLAERLAGAEGLQIVTDATGGRVALVLLSERAELPEGLLTGFNAGRWAGSAQGRALLERDWNSRLLEGEAVSLGELGFDVRSFDGRLYRRSVTIDLPADTYAADYDRAELALSLTYAAGLARDAEVIMRVNGGTITGFPMPLRTGDAVEDKILKVPLSAFQPGRNTIEIEARVSDPADAVCDPRQQIEGYTRFTLSDRSTIRFPRLARLAALPDLRVTMGTGFPYRDANAEPTVLAVARPGHDELSAAASFTTAVSIRAGQSLATRLVYGPPAADAPNAIIVGAIADLTGDVTGGLAGLSPEAFRRAWTQGVPSSRASDTRTADTSHLIPPASSDFVISQKVSADQEGVWTVLTAPDGAALANGVDSLLRPEILDALSGPTASHSRVEDTFVSSIASPRKLRLDDRSFSNSRIVLAGWFADNYYVFTGIMLLGVLGFGLLTNRTVTRSGVPSRRGNDLVVKS